MTGYVTPKCQRTHLACFGITVAFLKGQHLVVQKECGSGVSGSHAEALTAPLDTRVGTQKRDLAETETLDLISNRPVVGEATEWII